MRASGQRYDARCLYDSMTVEKRIGRVSTTYLLSVLLTFDDAPSVLSISAAPPRPVRAWLIMGKPSDVPDTVSDAQCARPERRCLPFAPLSPPAELILNSSTRFDTAWQADACPLDSYAGISATPASSGGQTWVSHLFEQVALSRIGTARRGLADHPAVHDLRRLGNVQLMSHIEFTVSTRLP
ncbi:Smad nuclear interacting protein 1 [Rhodotorula toruloides ATCC 204091]|nr:Smad nuclear interacting protein 1 [Rhodotorula toruloides ATCC 204091]